MEQNVLVTGASGFIGATLLRLARAGEWAGRYRFAALAREPVQGSLFIPDRRGRDGTYGFTARDVLSSGIDRVDHVVHLGAFIPKHPGEADDVPRNLASLANIHRLLDSLPNVPDTFVFASSIDVYGAGPQPMREDQVCRPLTVYGHSKLFGERLAERLAERPDRAGMRLRILRLGHVYGPGEERFRKFIPQAIRQLLRGDAPVFSASGRERRSFLYVDDCCRLIVRSLALEGEHGPINIASRRDRSLEEVADRLCRLGAELTGRRLDPIWAADAPAGRDAIPDTARMEALLGPDETPLETGLRREFEHMLAAGA